MHGPSEVKLSVESDDLRKLYLDLKDVEGNLRRQLRKEISAAGDESAQAVRAEAGNWSKRIPGAVRVVVSFSAKRAGVLIEVNKAKAPHARPYEHAGKPGTFRHRVFGRDVWVNQAARPFFFAQVDRSDAVEAHIRRAMNEVARAAGFTS